MGRGVQKATGRSNTRVTLALDIIRRLSSGPWTGYHELGIVKMKIALYDTITVEEADRTEIVCEDSLVPVDKTNLCWKAAEVMGVAAGSQAGVKIVIDKRIPVRGGLAGGSANAATVMTLLNELWGLGLGNEQLCRLGREVGMDVPFYFVGAAAFDTETGPWPQPLETGLDFDLVLAVPDFGVSTPEAYRGIDYRVTGRRTDDTAALVHALRHGDLGSVIAAMHNDFEHSVFRSHPQLEFLRQKMLDAGCRQVVLSGSGSTLVGVAEGKREALRCAKGIPARCIVTSTRIDEEPAGS